MTSNGIDQRAVALGWMNEFVDIARAPTSDRPAPWGEWEGRFIQFRDAPFSWYLASLPLRLMPAARMTSTSRGRYQAEVGALALALAAERHRRKSGRWPESPGAIDPEILPDPPLDPFSGEPFVMEEGDGYLAIYSVGPNLEDDGGEFDPKRWRDGGADDFGTRLWEPGRRGRPALDDREEAR